MLVPGKQECADREFAGRQSQNKHGRASATLNYEIALPTTAK
jgi:hypothetical protein